MVGVVSCSFYCNRSCCFSLMWLLMLSVPVFSVVGVVIPFVVVLDVYVSGFFLFSCFLLFDAISLIVASFATVVAAFAFYYVVDVCVGFCFCFCCFLYLLFFHNCCWWVKCFHCYCSSCCCSYSFVYLLFLRLLLFWFPKRIRASCNFTLSITAALWISILIFFFIYMQNT